MTLCKPLKGYQMLWGKVLFMVNKRPRKKHENIQFFQVQIDFSPNFNQINEVQIYT